MYWTIDGFEQLTEQEVVNISVAHVLKNGRPSLRRETLACLYSGIGCGAAPFLKEEHREAADNQGEEEGTSSAWMYLKNADCVPTAHSELVGRLQDCHDDAACDSSDAGSPFLPLYKEYVRSMVRIYNPSLSLPFSA